jgi:hypothetical protein
LRAAAIARYLSSMNQLILEAIALKKCIIVTYNSTKMLLAPHILYSRHESYYIDAVALERNGEPPKEKKLGAFNLAGLRDVALAERQFVPEELFNPADPKYDGVTMFAVDRAG